MVKKTITPARFNVSNNNLVNFGDKDVIMDILSSTKSLAVLYGNLVQEASNNDLLRRVKALSNEISNEQRGLFNFIYSKGWYDLEAEDKTKINKATKKFASQKKDVNW